MRKLIVIDGPAASGKGTLALNLAQHFGFQHLDSGNLYRAVASKVLETGSDPVDVGVNLHIHDLSRPDLRHERISVAASEIASIPGVRKGVNDFINRTLNEAEGCVMDGRAGAIEYPWAQVKIFLVCDVEERARRRVLQIKRVDKIDADYSEVLAELRARDERDRTRSAAPLMRMPGSFQIDTTRFTREQTLQAALSFCKKGFQEARIVA